MHASTVNVEGVARLESFPTHVADVRFWQVFDVGVLVVTQGRTITKRVTTGGTLVLL